MPRIGIGGEFRIRYTPPPGGEPWPDVWAIPNGPTDVGLNYILNASFRGGAQSPLWYVGLIDHIGFVGIDRSDTMFGSGPGRQWHEFTNVNMIGNKLRAPWVVVGSGSGRLVSSSPMNISILGNGKIQGAFLVDSRPASEAGGGILYATAAAANFRTVVGGSTLTITYGLRMIPRT